MGLLRLVFLLAVTAAVVWLLRDVLKRLGGWVDGGAEGRDDPAPPRLVDLERSAWDVLGLEEGASRFEVEAAWRRIMKDNAPDRVACLSPEIRELAARLREDATAAHDSLVRELEAGEDPGGEGPEG